MWADLLVALLLSLSLCADCLAVSLVSGLSLSGVRHGKVALIAAIFSVVHICFLLSGYFFGDLFVGYVEKFAHWIGFLLLLYVGGSMFYEAVAGKVEKRDLNGIRNILLSAVATSIDALAVGVSLSMDRTPVPVALMTAAVLLVITFLTVSVGILGGRKIGNRFGKVAEIVGSLILVGLGVGILI